MSYLFDQELEERLVRYAAIDSQSDETSTSSPSSKIQLDMLQLLEAELVEIGAKNVRLTDYGVVLATIPGTIDGPTIGLLAHVDTAPQFNATGVKPRVIRGYNGGDITFPDAAGLVLSPEEYPYLAEKVGQDIVTASGTTLLGADDKAGIAIIMTAARHLLNHSEISHGPIRIAFTPDEEIGRGVTAPLPDDLAADFAYTFDGAAVGLIEYESFSADAAEIRITGISIHPGSAKGKMVNALHLASKIIEPRAEISCIISPQYRNMRYWLESDMGPVDLARAASIKLGIESVSVPIRGGTDGSILTEMGVPTPNIFTGMQNIHGPLEWISVQDMAKATEFCLTLTELAGKKNLN